MKKHPVEIYKHYTLYIVSGTNPAFFIAEKTDPSKGATVTADSLEGLKKSVDKTLEYAANVKINVWQGPVNNRVLQNITARINTHGVNYNGFAIVVSGNIFAPDYISESDTDEEKERKEEEIELLIEIIRNQPIRVSKKYRKTNKHLNLAKFFKHNGTVHQR